MHISQLADKFVKDPYEVVSAGDVVKVRVVSVDLARKRVALTMRSGDVSATEVSTKPAPARQRRGGRQTQAESPTSNAMAQAFAKARK